MVLDYMKHFRHDDCNDYLFKLFRQDYPTNLKLQILDVLLLTYPGKENPGDPVSQIVHNEKKTQLYVDYLNLRNTETPSHQEGLAVVQTMFYGDPEFGGKGQCVGFDTPLKSLGNQLAKQTDLFRIITLGIHNDWSDNQTLVTQYSDSHWMIRLPAYLDMEDNHAFLRRQLFIKRFAAKFMDLLNVHPIFFIFATWTMLPKPWRC